MLKVLFYGLNSRGTVQSCGELELAQDISNFAYCYGLNFSKTMALLLSVLWDFSVQCRQITLVINQIQSANS